MKAWIAAVLIVVAAAAGFLAGRATAVPDTSLVPRTELDQALRERNEAQVRAARAEGALVATERRHRAPAEGGEEPGRDAELPAPFGMDGAAPAAVASAAPVPGTAAERQQEVRDLTARIDGAFERGDGESALELLRRLGSIVPEGRQAAMDLAARIHEDLGGAGTLHVDQYTFYSSLGDTGLRDLMIWAMENPSPTEFRVLSAWSLPWVLPGERKVDVLAKALIREKEFAVQQAILTSLSQTNDARAQAVLAGVVADPERDPGLRAQVITLLATSTNAEVGRAIAAAESDPDEKVRTAARGALLARNPPVDGFLLTMVLPDGAAAAAGLKAGDILVSYDGKLTRSVPELRDATEAAGADAAQVVVLRESGEVTVQVRRGRMSIQGVPVRRK